MTDKERAKSVVVTGDVTMDWNIATSQGTRGAIPNWNPDINSSVFWQSGGAAQLAELIEAVVMKLPTGQDYAVRTMEEPNRLEYLTGFLMGALPTGSLEGALLAIHNAVLSPWLG